jgi:hypothetical protein
LTKRVVVTVADLLPTDLSQMDSIIRAQIEKSEVKQLPAFAWKFLESKTNGAIHQALDCDVLDLLGKGWSAARELHKFTNTTLHPAGEKSILTLGKHTLTAISHPSLVITVDSVQLKEIRFTLELNANLRTAVLAIQDAHIQSVDCGEFSVSARLKYKEVVLYESPDSQDMPMFGEYTFKSPGLAIH